MAKRRQSSRQNSRQNNYPGHYAQYYSGASTAWELETYEQGQPKPEKKRRRRLRFRKKAVVFKDAGQTKVKFSKCTIISVMLIFVCAMGMALSCAYVLHVQMGLTELREDLNAKQEQTLILQTELTQSYDLTEIERIATTKLGMSKPKAHQVVVVNVPRQNYVQIEQDLPDEIPQGRVTNFLSTLLGQ